MVRDLADRVILARPDRIETHRATTFMNLLGKFALVTGASSGIGREIAVQLTRDRGMIVLATARREDRLRELQAECPAVRVLAGDLADPLFRDRLWTWALREAGEDGIELLVNNAGVGRYGEFDRQEEAHLRQIIDLNLAVPLDLTQKAISHMKVRKRGQIVQISSILGFVGIPYSAVYTATKHALNGLVKSLRYELRGSGVKVWAGCPGRTESEFASVARGGPPNKGDGPPGAKTDRVVRSILRGLDRDRAFVVPGLTPKAVVWAERFLPGPFDLFMSLWAPGYFRRESGLEKGSSSRQKIT